MQFDTIDYISAALAFEIYSASENLPPDEIHYPTTALDAKIWLGKHYSISDNDAVFTKALNRLSELSLISIDIDPYAGAFVSAEWRTFIDNLTSLIENFPQSPYHRTQRGGRPWISTVFQNNKYWEDLEEDANRPVNHGIISEADKVIKLERDENYEKLLSGLTKISGDLLRDNEISEYLGDDSDRIRSELEASQKVLTANEARKSVILSLLIGTLKELISKLKDKFYDKLTTYGLEKLLDTAIKLMNQI